MQRRLDTEGAKEALFKAGLKQTEVAKHLGVSREAVSQWMKGTAFPRPDKLLRLGKLLRLSVDELVITEDPHTPRVAFRKVRGARTTKSHLEKAQSMGRMLRHLVPYLPFDPLVTPPVLKAPICDYDYLQSVAMKVREEINLSPTDEVNFSHLIRRFRDLQTVVVPVMWGAKQRHENAVHIYLPDSQSTWVYLNLDTNLHDFKFWMAHELGHCLSPSLDGEEAEDFADALAGSLLYPRELAERAHARMLAVRASNKRIDRVLHLADEMTISPYTVLTQVNQYAEAVGKKKLDLSNAFFGAMTNFNKEFRNVSDGLLGDDPSANKLIAITESAFDTPMFQMLRSYLKEHGIGPGYVQTVLDVSLLDARSIHAELT